MNTSNFVFVYVLFTAIGVGDASDTKRLVLHDDGDVAATLEIMSVQIAELTANLSATSHTLSETQQKLTEATNKIGQSGSTFVRWGRTACPSNSELVYKGYTAGGPYDQAGGAADYICVTQEPIWGHYDSAHNTRSGYVYGAEYEFHQQHSGGGSAFFGQHLGEHDVPCSICSSNLPRTIMIPGRNQCYPGWTLQYSGYLVSGYAGEAKATNYVCLDSRPEVESGDVRNDNGVLMYTVEAVCGSLKCPPYVQYREITCAVCSK